MQELVRLTTTDFELVVRANNICPRLKVYQSTLASKTNLGAYLAEPNYLLQIFPVIEFDSVSIFGTYNTKVVSKSTCCEFQLNQPLFFENTQYQFEWEFFSEVTHAELTHPNYDICDAFIFVPERKTQRGVSFARLSGNINTGNDVGWLRLPLSYQTDGKLKKMHLQCEVLPTKMLLHKDLPKMYKDIDAIYPLWRFSLARKTEQSVSSGIERAHFPLMWLKHFENLRENFEQGLKVITASPHSRLQSSVMQIKAARLKGKISLKLSQKVKIDLVNGKNDKHYRVEKKILSVDTPENRFIKMLVQQSKQQLAKFEVRLRKNNDALEHKHLSETFLEELRSWQQPLQKLLNQSFLKEVGDFSGMSLESMVLQQKTGYSTVYRVWQELKLYLNLFGGQTSISIKSVAEIYEVWCFLCLKKILEQELEFEMVHDKKIKITQNNFYEYQLVDGQVGALHFERSDGVKAVLEHEYIFTTKGNPFCTYLVTQKPDIVLKVSIPANAKDEEEKQFIWLFDAKYRIEGIITDEENQFAGKPNKYSLNEQKDGVPDDAINQMHRYRDALIRLTKMHDSGKQSKSRPVFGAFALYPGFYDQTKLNNPYASAISEIGIGAFALLPSQNNGANENSGYKWLVDFLKEQIGLSTNFSYSARIAERLYVQEAARISYGSMRQNFYYDLTLTFSIAGQKGRDATYFNRFKDGTAKFYHTKVSTFNNKYAKHVVNEIRYLALAITNEKKFTTKRIEYVWPVLSVQELPRYKISKEQSGKDSNSIELYYLFSLGNPLLLFNPITAVPHRPLTSSIKLTTLHNLEKVDKFSEIESVYEMLLAQGIK